MTRRRISGLRWELVSMIASLVIPLGLVIVLPNPTKLQALLLRLVSALGMSSVAAYAVRRWLGPGSKGRPLAARVLVFVLSFFALEQWVIPALQRLSRADLDLDAVVQRSTEHAERCDNVSEDSSKTPACALELARRSLDEGDLARARTRLDDARARVAELAPEDARVPAYRARALELTGDIETAAMLQAGDGPAAAEHRQRGVAALGEAISAYEQAGDALGGANAALRLATLELRAGEHEAARADLDRAEQLYDAADSKAGRAAVARARGDLAASTGDTKTAKAAYDEARATYNELENAEAIASVTRASAELAWAEGDKEHAVAQLQQSAQTFAELGDDSATKAVEQQIARLKGDKPDKGIKRVKPSDPSSRWDCASPQAGEAGDRARARALWQQGNEAFRRGQHGDAAAAYLEARDADPRYASPYYSLGYLAMERRDWERAERCLEVALELRPDHAGTRNNLAVVYRRLGKTDAAREQIDATVTSHKSYGPALLNKAIDELDKGKPREAKKWADRARKTQEKQPQTQQQVQQVQQVQTRIELEMQRGDRPAPRPVEPPRGPSGPRPAPRPGPQ